MAQGVDPKIMDIMRRFQPTGDFDGNTSLSNDPEGFAMVSQEDIDSVGHQRPPFNWPAKSSPQSNFFVIDGMAVDTLTRSGFVREARSLRAKLRLNPPNFDKLPSLLHHYLDMEPANADQAKIAKLQAMADEMGLDVHAMGKVHKKRIKNILAHKAGTAEAEWLWLVSNAANTSAFGKTAACELSLPTIARLIEIWLPQLGQPPKLPESDPSFANLAWFHKNFPMGWSHIDHLGESAVVSAPLLNNFSGRLAMAYFEMADKIGRGWTESDARLFAFNHKNNADMNGAAVFGLGASDHFKDKILPILSGQAAAPARTGPAGHLATFIQGSNPGLAGQHEEMTLWMLYRAVDPESADLIQTAFMDPKHLEAHKKPGQSHSAMLARLERLELESTHASFWTLGPSAAMPALALAQKGSMRL
jgi:hypothetical protein